MLASGTMAVTTWALPRLSVPCTWPRRRIEVADHAAQEILRRHDFDLHDRLEQLDRALDRQFAEGGACGDVEGERVGVNFVIVAVDQRGLEVDHREAGHQARFLLRLEALFHRGMNSLGTEPPTTSFSNTKPTPGCSGSKSILTSANWPEPPVCFLWV